MLLWLWVCSSPKYRMKYMRSPWKHKFPFNASPVLSVLHMRQNENHVMAVLLIYVLNLNFLIWKRFFLFGEDFSWNFRWWIFTAWSPIILSTRQRCAGARVQSTQQPIERDAHFASTNRRTHTHVCMSTCIKTLLENIFWSAVFPKYGPHIQSWLERAEDLIWRLSSIWIIPL